MRAFIAITAAALMLPTAVSAQTATGGLGAPGAGIDQTTPPPGTSPTTPGTHEPTTQPHDGGTHGSRPGGPTTPGAPTGTLETTPDTTTGTLGSTPDGTTGTTPPLGSTTPQP